MDSKNSSTQIILDTFSINAFIAGIKIKQAY